jgi:hypothetical protein
MGWIVPVTEQEKRKKKKKKETVQETRVPWAREKKARN